MVVDSRPRRARPGQRRQLRLITALVLLAAALGMIPWPAVSASDTFREAGGSAVAVAPPQTADPAFDDGSGHARPDPDDLDGVADVAVADQAPFAATAARSVIAAEREIAVDDPGRSATGPRAPPRHTA